MNVLRFTVYLALASLVLVACSGDETVEPAVTLRASQKVIREGESVTLSWDMTGSMPMTLSMTPPMDIELVSPLTVTPTATTTYTLTASNSAGSDSSSVEVVVERLPELLSFEVSSESIVQGRSLTVSWETSSDDPVTATLTPSDTPDEPVTSPLTLSPTETTTYTLILTNSVGSTGREFTVIVNPPAAPTINSFTSTPTPGDGLEVTFAWSLSAPSPCSLIPGDGSPELTFDDCSTTTEVRHTYSQAGQDYPVTLSLPSGASQTLSINVSVTDTPTNAPPIVDAGEDFSVLLGEFVSVTGQVSDPDGDPLTPIWEITSQPDTSTAVATTTLTGLTFTPDVIGEYVVRVTASDGSNVVSDEVTITALTTDTSPTNTVYFLQDATPINLAEGQTQVITLERTGTTVNPLTVYLQLGEGTTATEDDYSITGVTLNNEAYEVTFEAQRSRTEFTLVATNDNLEEVDEQIVFSLIQDDTYTQGQPASITIRLNDEADEPDEPNNPNEPDTPGEPNNPDPSEPELRRCEGIFVITSQEELETLAGCEIIAPRLIIDPTEPQGFGIGVVEGNSPITSLAPLSELQEVVSTFWIRNVSNLTSLAGLERLSRGDLIIKNNRALESLTGLSGFESGYIELENNDALTSMQGLNGLTSGDLFLRDNDSLASLQGLENVVTINRLFLKNNPNLTSLDVLVGIQDLNMLWLDSNMINSLEVFSNITSMNILVIKNSKALTSLTGLENVASVGSLEISGTENLTSLVGLGNIAAAGSVRIVDNSALETVAGLDKLRAVDKARVDHTSGLGQFEITGNSALTSLAALNDLRRVQFNLEIQDNAVLPSLTGLANVESIGGNLIVSDNSTLTSLAALSSLVNADIAGESTISDNENLDCPAQNLQFAPEMSQGNLINCVLRSKLIPQVTSFTATPNSIEVGQAVTLMWDAVGTEPIEVEILPEVGSVATSGSATVSPSQSDTYTLTATNTYGTTSQGVTVTVETSQTQVCEGDIDATTQAEVDALRECSSITGNLLIKEAQEGTIFSLRALENLERIEGGLTIGGVNIDVFPYISANSELPSLEGLDNLEFVGGNLFIGGNRLLTSLEGLNKLSRVGGNVTIGAITWVPGPLASLDSFTLSNDSLTSLSGLEGLRSIGRSLSITANYSLTSLSGLEGLRSIPDNLHISNASLTSLEGLDNIVFVSQNVEIWTGDGALTSLAALNNLTSIGGSLIIDFNRFGISSPSSFTSLEGLNNLASIGADLKLGETITSLAPLANLQTVENIYLYDTALTDLAGLENISSLTTLELIRNKSLTSTAGLTSLSSVETFEVSGNGALSSLQGLDSLTSIGRLEITDEPALTAMAGMQNLASVNDFILVNTGLSSFAPLNNVNVTNHLAIDKSQLSSLAGLEGTVELGVNLIITNNPRLTSLTGLNNLVIVSSETPLFRPELYAGRLFIRNNNALVSLEGLEKLEQVRGPMYVLGNASLTSIEQLAGIEDYNDSLYEVTVANNPSFDCGLQPVLPFIVDISTGNLINCPTP